MNDRAPIKCHLCTRRSTPLHLHTHFSSVLSRLSEHEQFLSWDIFDLFDLIRWLEKENMLYMVSQNFRSYCNIHI
jgi:hypothetical protein